MSSVMNKVKDALHLNHDDDNMTDKPKCHGAHCGNTNTSDGTFGSQEANSGDSRINRGQNSSQCERTKSTSCQDTCSGPGSYRYRKSAPETCAENDVNNTPSIDSGNFYHNSSLANTLDPRVGSGISSQYRSTQDSGNSQNNFTRAPSDVYSSNTAPHQSDLLNKLDSKTDSNRNSHTNDHKHAHGSVFNAPEDYYVDNLGKVIHPSGSHGTEFANKMDPRVDSYRH